VGKLWMERENLWISGAGKRKPPVRAAFLTEGQGRKAASARGWNG
jgi:hypothetical protein